MLFRSGSNSSIKDFFNLKTLLNPGILCCFVAAFLFLLDVPVPAVFLDVLDSVGGLTSPIAMMLVGASLAVMDIKELFGDCKIYVYTVLRQIVLPIGAWFLIRPMIQNELLATVTLIMVSMPVANSAVLFATEYQGDENTAAKGIFLTTLVSLVTIPLLLATCL